MLRPQSKTAINRDSASLERPFLMSPLLTLSMVLGFTPVQPNLHRLLHRRTDGRRERRPYENSDGC